MHVPKSPWGARCSTISASCPAPRSVFRLLENGRIELVAAAASDDVKSPRSALQRLGSRPVSLEEIWEAIEAGDVL